MTGFFASGPVLSSVKTKRLVASITGLEYMDRVEVILGSWMRPAGKILTLILILGQRQVRNSLRNILICRSSIMDFCFDLANMANVIVDITNLIQLCAATFMVFTHLTRTQHACGNCNGG